MKRRSLFERAVVAVIWAWMSALVVAPTLLVLGASFGRRDEASFVVGPPTLANYARLLDPLYFDVFRASVEMAALTTVLCLAAGYPFAWIASRARPGVRPVLLFLVVAPFWTNSLVRVYAMNALLAVHGAVNAAARDLGLLERPLRMLYTRGAVVAGLTYLLLPFMILPLYAVFEQLRRDLLEASADLGAPRWRTFLHVVLPLTMPGIVAGCLLTFLPALGLFYIGDTLGGGRTLVAGNVIKNQFLDARDWPFGAAASVTLTVAMGVLLGAYWWTARRAGRAVAGGGAS